MVHVIKPLAWVLSIDPSGHFDYYSQAHVYQSNVDYFAVKSPIMVIFKNPVPGRFENKTKEPHSSRNYNMLLYVLSFYLYYLAWRQLIIFSCVRIEMAFGRLTTKWRICCHNLEFSSACNRIIIIDVQLSDCIIITL